MKDHFVDILAYAMIGNDTVRVFTNDYQYISQDCKRLTKAGADFFANNIDWSKIPVNK